MNRPQATLQELLGNRKIRLTRYIQSQKTKRIPSNVEVITKRQYTVPHGDNLFDTQVESSPNSFGRTGEIPVNNYSQEFKSKKLFGNSPDTNGRSSRDSESVGERQHTNAIHTYRFYDKIREYNDQVGGV